MLRSFSAQARSAERIGVATVFRQHPKNNSAHEHVAAAVFVPAGMSVSGFFDRRWAEPNIAEGFDPGLDGRLERNIFKSPPIGSLDGGALVTAGDLLRFVAAVRAGMLFPAELTTLM